MTTVITCPHCETPVDPKARFCGKCGVDLAMAVAVAEQSLSGHADLPDGTLLAPEMLVPRIGETMIEQGLITPEELQTALDYQAESSAAGEPVLLGQALLKLGAIDQATLDGVVTQQILSLHSALKQANLQLEQRVWERTLDLQHALDRLTELNQLKANFIANISHELRTPLTHIKGYLDLLVDNSLGPLTKAQKDALKVLQRSEIRLERLIEDLIQFSLAYRGEFSLNLSTVLLQDVVREAGDGYRSKAAAAGITLSAHCAEGLPPVQADKEKIAWAISQLLDNAIKFTPSGGQVDLQAEHLSGRVRISVSDTGIGIPQDRLGEIFEAFHQLDSSATRRYGGTGLGLALVDRIIAAHGASINVRSVLGSGSRFEFSLRALESPDPVSTALQAEAGK